MDAIKITTTNFSKKNEYNLNGITYLGNLTNIDNSLVVSGEVTLNSRLNVSNDVSLNAFVDVSDGLNVVGPTTLSTLVASTDVSFERNVYIGGNLLGLGDISLAGSLYDRYGDPFTGSSSSIFTSNDDLNFYTQKNVSIGTTDICSNFRLNVVGGVRIFNNNSSDEYYIPSNDWIPDLSNNIYYINGKVGIGTVK